MPLVDIDISAFRGELVLIVYGCGLPTGGVGGNWKPVKELGYDGILWRPPISKVGECSASEFVSKDCSCCMAPAPFAKRMFCKAS